jgi:hypothetical protein
MRPPATRCSWHKPDDLSYEAAHLDADKRLARGEHQRQCDDCKRWFWKHEFGKKKGTTP